MRMGESERLAQIGSTCKFEKNMELMSKEKNTTK